MGTRGHATIAEIARWTAIAAPSVYVVMTVVLQLLNSDLNRMQYTLSDLALKRYGSIETVAACLLGVSLLALSFGLYSNIKSTKTAKGFAAALAVMGPAFFLVAAFQTSNSDVVTSQVIVHRAAVVTIAVAFPVACLLTSAGLRPDIRWRDLATYCAVAGVISILLDLITTFVPHRTQQDIAGLWEKASLANAVILCQVLGVRLFVVSRTAGRS